MLFTSKQGNTIYYDFFPTLKNDAKTLVLLHGWGGPILWNNFIPNFLLKDFQIISVHLPGFGQSPLPNNYQSYNSYSYAQDINDLLNELDVKKAIIMGHSLGGKIATILNAQYRIGSKLILIAASCFRRFYITVWIKNRILKTIKVILKLFTKNEDDIRQSNIYKLFLKVWASDDYRQADPQRRIILDNVIHDDVRGLLPKIKVPTLIVWGDRDEQTPLIDAIEMHKLIPNSTLKIIRDMNHFLMLVVPEVLYKLILDFSYKNESDARKILNTN